MWFGIHLVKSGHITPGQLVEAIERQLGSQVLIGHLAVEQGKLSMEQVCEILIAQADTHQPFGEIAVDRNLLQENELAELILSQSNDQMPIGDVLVEMGVLTKEVADAELEAFREKMTSACQATQDDLEFLAGPLFA